MVERTDGRRIERTMKTIFLKCDKWRVTSAAAKPEHSCHPSPFTRHPAAFTLIELLVVITIIGVLAAFTIPVLSSVKRQQYIRHTQAELALLETAIERYKATYGFYPPS